MMEKKRGTQDEKWNELDGSASGKCLEAFLDSESDGYAILQLKRTKATKHLRFMSYDAVEQQGQNPLRGIEDQMEQNDNQLDGIINNMPEETIAEKESKSSVIEKLKASVPDLEYKLKSTACEREIN